MVQKNIKHPVSSSSACGNCLGVVERGRRKTTGLVRADEEATVTQISTLYSREQKSSSGSKTSGGWPTTAEDHVGFISQGQEPRARKKIT